MYRNSDHASARTGTPVPSVSLNWAYCMLLRIERRNDMLQRTQLPAEATREQFALLQSYLAGRHAGGGMSDMGLFDYVAMVEETPVDTMMIEYRLSGENGGEVCKLALRDSHTQRIAQAIFMLRDNYAKPIRIERLAQAARMSPSSFHQHFKALTSMTPLQYQKQLRLQAARDRMLSGIDATTAAYEVGYESVSQFSREYSRFFGQPPIRDIKTLREGKTAAIQVA